MLYENVKAFAEVWISPDGAERDARTKEFGRHMLLVIDVDTIGRFEAELFVHENKTIDFSLFCPSGYEDSYKEMMKNIPALFGQSAYKLGVTNLSTMGKSRSLMDVFKSLPYKRVGVDVKI